MSVGLSVRRKLRSYSYSKEPLYTQMSVGRSVRKKHSRYAEKAYVNNQSNSLQPFIVKTQRNSTQLKTTLKQLALELDIVVTCSTQPTTPLPQTFQPLLDNLRS